MIISAGEIHLWFSYNENIHDSDLLAKYYDLLNPEESAQYKRFYFDKHRQQYLVTRALVRSVLSLYEDHIAPAEWTFIKNSYGKPSISNTTLKLPLRFNISHTDKLVVMAVTLDSELGVDVEYLPRLGKMLEIANNFFSPSEVKELFELPPEKQQNRFFDLWTLKEAYIKACGMGLSIPLDHFSYSFSQQGKISVEFKPERNDQPQYWKFWQIHPSPEHKVSIAIKSANAEKKYSVLMREITPLSTIAETNYPIGFGNIISA